MVRKNCIFKIVMIMFCLFWVTESFAQDRIALVIGNGDYEVQSLKNPTNDAMDISKTLRSLEFNVDLKLNASQEDMETSIQQFGEKLQGNTVGLFYYSGHGVQHEGSNYLIPIGAMSQVSAPDHLRYKTVDIGYILGVMKQARNGLNIVILDACRNNPFKSFSRSMNKGLRRISGAEGTIIAYSTSPGKVALDGSDRNSPYTAQLIKLMKKPNLPVEIFFKQVRKGVKLETSGRQSPWYEASIDGNFFFKPKSVDLLQDQKQLASSHTPTIKKTNSAILTVRSNVYHDSVYVNGELFGSTRLDVNLPLGTYEITVKKNGYASYTKKIELNGNQVIKANLSELSSSTLSFPNFEIDKNSTDGLDFSKCVDAGICDKPSYDEFNRDPDNGGKEPAMSITWYMANDYCKWLGKRLPTLDEYKKSWKFLKWRGCCVRGVIPREWVSDSSNKGEDIGVQVRATPEKLNIMTLNKSRAYDSTTVRCACDK